MDCFLISFFRFPFDNGAPEAFSGSRMSLSTVTSRVCAQRPPVFAGNGAALRRGGPRGAAHECHTLCRRLGAGDERLLPTLALLLRKELAAEALAGLLQLPVARFRFSAGIGRLRALLGSP